MGSTATLPRENNIKSSQLQGGKSRTYSTEKSQCINHVAGQC